MLNQDSVCYRHKNTKAAVSCQRCEKPICISCMKQASVGFHCPDCMSTGSQQVHTASTVFGRAQGSNFLKGLLGLLALIFLAENLNLEFAGFAFRDAQREFLLSGPAISEAGQWWRIVTSGFVHGSIFHIGFNCYALWIIGQVLEEQLGKIKMLLVFFGGLLGGSLAVLLFNFDVPTLGASGAVMGLVGAWSLILWLQGINIFKTSLGFIIGLNLLLPLMGTGISFWGHFGGLLGGVLVAGILSWLPTAVAKKPAFGVTIFSERVDIWVILAAGICLILFAAAFVVGSAGFYISVG